MRGLLLAVAIALLLLALPPAPAHLTSPASPALVAGRGVGEGSGSVGAPARVETPSAGPTPVALYNETFLPGEGFPPAPLAGAGLPQSAVVATPPPPVPSTTPTVLTFLTNARNTSLTRNFSAPPGPWATIVLNFTGQVVLGVYDSSYRAYIDRTQVMFGTSPEYGTWTVLDNLSEYASLFETPASLTFLFDAAVTNGYFLTNLSIAFYPLPPGGQAPAAPGLVVPLWFRQPLTPAAPRAEANATLPANASSAELQLYLYGFAGDEFWWSTPNPARVVEFGVNSTPIGAVLPFPFINTGGIDLFLWRPLTAALTTNDRPYTLNLTSALGQLEGSHTLWLNFTGISAGSNWLVAGSLLVWTNASYLGATATNASFAGPAIFHAGGGTSDRVTSFVGSEFRTTAGTVNVTSALTETFASSVPSSSTWANISQSTTLNERTTTRSPSATTVESLGYTFPLSVDLGGQVSPSSGTYPYPANFSTYMLNTFQAWNEARTITDGSAPGSAVLASSAFDDQLAGASGVVTGSEIVTGPNSATLTSYTLISSSSTKQLTERLGPSGSILYGVGGGTGWSTYSHLLVGSSFQPPPPENAETVVTNLVQSAPFPLRALLNANPAALALGTNLTLTAVVSGGDAPYTYNWTGLPSGCAPANSSVVTCAPRGAAIYPVSLSVVDAAGARTPPITTDLVVVTPLAVTLELNRTVVDVGGAVQAAPLLSGGLPPFACTWVVTFGPPGATSPCGSYLVETPGAGSWRLAVEVTDGLGERVVTPSVNVTVSDRPVLSLDSNLTAGASVAFGTPVAFSTALFGGSPPFVFLWTVNGEVVNESGGPALTFVPSSLGNVSVRVAVIDAAGVRVESNAFNFTVGTGFSPGPAGAPATSGDLVPYLYLALAAVALEAGLVAWLAHRRRPPAPPRQRAPPPRGKPTARPNTPFARGRPPAS